MRERAKRTVLMMPGPLHLFWTNGALYLSELHANFRLVLVVPATYRDSGRFQRFAQCHDIAEIAYLPEGSAVLRHVRLNRLFSRIARKHRAELLLLHNDSYAENQYAIHHAQRFVPACVVFIYQNSRVPLDWPTVFRAQLKNGTIRLVRLGMPAWLARRVVLCYRKLCYLTQLKLLPLCLAGRSFDPQFDVFNYVPIRKRAFADSRVAKRCYTLAYFSVEAEQLRNAGSPNTTLIAHPVRTRAGLEEIYGNGPERCEILILPSCDVPSNKFDIAAPAEVAGRKLADLWIDALSRMKRKFPGTPLAMKLHPLAATDPLGLQLVAYLQATFGDLKIQPPEVPAERLILEASIVVSDVSAVLWWAALLGGKTVVSLDIFGFEGGDQLKRFEGIHYLDDVLLIENLPVARQTDASLSKSSRPSVSEFLAKICQLERAEV